MRGGIESFVTTSQQKVCDLVPSARPLCKRAATKKFWIIGMSQNNQNFF